MTTERRKRRRDTVLASKIAYSSRVAFPDLFESKLELSSTNPLFIVNLLIEDDQYSNSRSYLSGRIKDVISLLSKHNSSENNLQMIVPEEQLPNEKAGSRSISTILEVLKGENESGESVHIYRLDDGKELFDSPLAASKEGLRNIKRIYFRAQ